MGFRQRFGYLAPAPLIWDDAPESLRNRFIQVLREWTDRARARGQTSTVTQFYSTVCFELGIAEDFQATQNSWTAQIKLEGLFREKSWHDVFEIIELFVRRADQNIVGSINAALLKDNIGWRIKDWEFTRLEQDPSTRMAVAAASAALQDPRLDDVRKHYTKALSLFNSLRQPDPENAIKEAILCLEQVGKIVLGRASATLGEIAEGLAGNQIPKPLDGILRSLHGYSSQNWIRHSGGSVLPEEAQFIMGVVSNSIAYLASKLPREKVNMSRAGKTD